MVNIRQKASFKRTILIALGLLASFVVLIIVMSFIFSEIQEPMFFNRDLAMQNELIIPSILEAQIIGE